MSAPNQNQMANAMKLSDAQKRLLKKLAEKQSKKNEEELKEEEEELKKREEKWKETVTVLPLATEEYRNGYDGIDWSKRDWESVVKSR